MEPVPEDRESPDIQSFNWGVALPHSIWVCASFAGALFGVVSSATRSKPAIFRHPEWLDREASSPSPGFLPASGRAKGPVELRALAAGGDPDPGGPKVLLGRCRSKSLEREAEKDHQTLRLSGGVLSDRGKGRPGPLQAGFFRWFGV